MAGNSSRFYDYGFKTIKYDLPVDLNLTTMIDKAIETIGIDGKYILLTRDKTGITEGPACTVNVISDELNDNEELIVANCDQIMDYDSNEFLNECRKYDGCVMTYNTGKKLEIGTIDKHSYIAFNPTRLTEKIVISENALTGIHYFKKVKYFKDAYNHMISINRRAPNGEFYISLVFQSMVDLGLTVGMYKIDTGFYPVGEPSDYFKYLYEKGGYKNTIFDIYDGYRFGDTPVTYKNDKIYVNNQEINYDVSGYTRGWIIGNFEPSIIKTTDYELGILSHDENEKWDFHYHKESDEINFLFEGEMLLNGVDIKQGQVFIIPKNQIACPKFKTKCRIACVKIPSVPGDKNII